MSDFVRDLADSVNATFQQKGFDVISYVGKISDGGCAQLYKALKNHTPAKNVLLWLSTTGGSAHAGYRIARCLQERYERVTAYVSTLCKSAGTLVVIGAHDLVMGDEAELGPLDIQIQKRDELWEYGSGLDSIEALELLKGRALSSFKDHILEMRVSGEIPTKIASEVAKSLTLGLLAPIAAQLDPVSLGETSRRLRIAKEYSLRLDYKADNLKSDALDMLLTGYPSHSFVIDRNEARSLFGRVRAPTEEELEVFSKLSPVLRADRRNVADDDPKVIIVNQIIDDKLRTSSVPQGPPNASNARSDEEKQPEGSEPSVQPTQQAGNGNGTPS